MPDAGQRSQLLLLVVSPSDAVKDGEKSASVAEQHRVEVDNPGLLPVWVEIPDDGVSKPEGVRFQQDQQEEDDVDGWKDE